MINDNNSYKYNAILTELRQLYEKAQSTEKEAYNGYVYTNTYQDMIKTYNDILRKYNELTGSGYTLREVQNSELSTTQKTVRNNVIQNFINDVNKIIITIETDIKKQECVETTIPLHQMRKCFKTGANRCQLNPSENRNKVFIAMPFSDDYKDSFDYGVKIALDQLGMEHYKADNEVSNIDIMCKICREIQCCGTMIANISGLNPNVMFELGLAYGLGKKVIIIKDKKTTQISDLGSVEYIEYAHAGELQTKIMNAF